MQGKDIELEKIYQCESLLLSHPFKGKVINILDHSCIVEIVEAHKEDEATIRELQNKTVISFNDMEAEKS